MSDQYAMWRQALATPKEKDRPPIALDHPEAGYYRVKREGVWQPVHYEYTDGALSCFLGRGQQPAHHHVALDMFSWAWKNPISEETYFDFCLTGKWADLDDAVQSQMGGNKPPLDEFEQLSIDIENAGAAVDRYKTINDDETSKAAQSARARLNELSRTADKRREELVAPALKTQRDINAKWQPLVKAAKLYAEAIGKAMGVWETKKAQARAKQIEEEQRAADRAIAEGTPPSAMETHTAEPALEVNATIKGGYGRAASVKFEKIIKAVTNWDALIAHYAKDESVRGAVRKLADRDVRNGHNVPGVEIGEEAKVR